MPRVLVGGKLSEAGLAILRAAPDIEMDYVEEVSTASLDPYLASADAILLRTQPFGADSIAKAPLLKIVSRHGVGYDSVDVKALTARRIPLTIVGDVNSQAVAEHAMLMMLAASRRLLDYDAAVRPGGDWVFRNTPTSREVWGKSLLIVGLGRIGRQLASVATAFQMDVRAYDPYLTTSPPDGVAMLDDLDAALADADFVSLHIPGSDRQLIGADQIALMKPTAVIVNTSRGGLIDEDALAAALSAGKLQGAGLDVFETEPPNTDTKIFSRREAILTPHSASMTIECAERMATVSAKNIVDYFNGRLNPALVVNGKAIGFKQNPGETQ